MQKAFEDIIGFIRDIYGQPDGDIHLHEPVFCGSEKKYLLECIDSTFVSSVGKFVDAFEDALAEYTGANRAVLCVNGTCALHLALRVCSIKQNDEVLTQSMTFVAALNAISYHGAHPVFLDVDRQTLGLSPSALQSFLDTETVQQGNTCLNKRTKRRIKACIPMHTFGHPCKIDRIVEICSVRGIEVIEDAAESMGSFYKGQHTGTFGTVGVLSFNGNKTITCGGGGALLFKDTEQGAYAKHLSTQAKVPHPWEFSHDDIGYNYRMPNINAALGLAQLESLPQYLKAKRELAEKYGDLCEKCGITFVKEPANARSNYWLNSVILADASEKEAFLRFCHQQGIKARPVWELMNELPMFKEHQSVALSNSKWLQDRIVNLPSSVII